MHEIVCYNNLPFILITLSCCRRGASTCHKTIKQATCVLVVTDLDLCHAPVVTEHSLLVTTDLDIRILVITGHCVTNLSLKLELFAVECKFVVVNMSTVDPAQLKRIRAGHRGVATRRIGEIEAALGSPDPDKVRLKQLKLGIQEAFDTLKQLEKELAPHIDEASVSTEIEQNEKVKDAIFAALAKLDASLSSTAMTPTSPAVSATSTMAKLPKLALKSFHGNLTGWSVFWDAYKAAILRQRSLPT